MEEADNTSESRAFTDQELRNAGASELFITYYNEASPTATARSEVDRGPFTLDELSNNPRLGGGFFAALWSGERKDAFARADSRNLQILENATGSDKATVLGWPEA